MDNQYTLRPYFTEKYVEAGVDEVGRGCLAGPVVAAAVILPKDFYHPVLNDSKQLSFKQREEVKKDIERNAITFAVAEISNTIIDEVNILNASFLAMHKALDQLAVIPELILVDGNRFRPYKFIPYHCIVQGDAKFYAIAAASVIAKCYRDELMYSLSSSFPHYGWETNVGYPTIEHRKAIEIHGITEFHRKSFKVSEVVED